jgi:inner membrane protein
VTGRTHDLAAATLLFAVVLSQPLRPIALSTAAIALLANQIGGIAPDIDQPTAPFWRNLPVGKLFGKVTQAVLGGHRFLSHSLLGLALFGFGFKTLLTFLGPVLGHVDTGLIWWAFMLGMVSHLVMDSLTREGVPWLLPVPYKFGFPPLKRLRIVTGKKFESLIIFPGLVVLNGLLFSSNYEKIMTFAHFYIR